MTRMGNRKPILIAGAMLASFVFAQEPGGPQDGADVPGRAARLGLVQGTVSFQPASVEDWVPATPNRPMTTGDRLWTEGGSRVEVHLGSAAFRLNGRTNFSFINLDDRIAQVQLSLGTLAIRVRRLADDEAIEIDTPQAALSILRPGEYRVDVNEQGDATIVTTRSGEMEATAGQAYTIHPREQVRIMGAEGQNATFDTRPAPVSDGFDNWCQDRDRREDRSESARYVSREMPGYADLDGAGAWQQYPEYGAVWFPRGMPGDWAPYHYGHWAWISPWGWTWVDDAAWGYAPFHYGRWVFVGGGWGWVPGPVVVNVRPVYAPALVAWVGGPRFGVAIGIGAGVGWFPLGPREVFVPSYRYSGAYIERVNVTNTVIVNRTVIREVDVNRVTYVNRGVPGGVTVVSNETIVRGGAVATAAVRVNAGSFRDATIVTHAAVVPERGAVLGGREAVRVAPPAMVASRTVVTRNAPPPPPPSFDRQRSVMQSNPGRPLDRPSMSRIEPAQSQRPMYRQAPAIQQQQQQQQAPPANNNRPQMRPEDRRVNTPPPSQPQQQQDQPRRFERQNQPPVQQQQQQQQQQQDQPRRFERAPQPPQQQPPQPRTFERNAPPPQQEQKQQERQKEERRDDRQKERREREKEKS